MLVTMRHSSPGAARRWPTPSSCSRPPTLRLPVRHVPAAASAAADTVSALVFVHGCSSEQFAQNVSGEWEGVIATFSAEGQRQQLPEHYVPGAYREWGVELYDWQSQCSSTVTSSGELRVLVRRLMPTVGCEADAIAFTEDTSISSGASQQQLLAAGDGSYCLSPAQLAEGASKLTLESCFAVAPLQRRVRVVQQLLKDWRTQRWQVYRVEVHQEKYDGPYTGKRELAGCGGGQRAISELPQVDQQQLTGSWQPDAARSSSYVRGPDGWSLQSAASSRTSEAADAATTSSSSSSDGASGVQVTCLPLGAYSRVTITGDTITAEAGVLLDSQQQQDDSASSGAAAAGAAAQRYVCLRQYQGSQLELLTLGVEQREV